MQTTTKQHYFDRYWQQQDKYRVSRRAEWRTEQLFDLIKLKYHSLLDIGAGQGELIAYFRTAGYRVEAWDVSPYVVNDLITSGYSAKLVDLDSDHYDGAFDVVACCEVLQQVDDPAGVLRKASSVLKYGGRVFYSVPNEFHIFRRMGFGTPSEAHVHLFTPRKAVELAEISGYEVETEIYQPLVPPRWGKVCTFLGVLLAKALPSLFSLSTLILAKRKNES